MGMADRDDTSAPRRRPILLGDRRPFALPAAVGLALLAASSVPVLRFGAVGLVVAVPAGGFFGLAAAYGVYRAVVSPVAVTVAEDGLVDRSSLAGVGFVAWSEVKAVGIYKRFSQRYVTIQLRHPERIIGQLPRWKQTLIRFNRLFESGEVIIAETVLPYPAEHLVAEIRAHVERSELHPPAATKPRPQPLARADRAISRLIMVTGAVVGVLLTLVGLVQTNAADRDSAIALGLAMAIGCTCAIWPSSVLRRRPKHHG